MKRANLRRKWSTIRKAGSVSAVDCEGRTIWIVDAHRDDGKRFVVHADEKLSAFVELEKVTRESFCFKNAEKLVKGVSCSPL